MRIISIIILVCAYWGNAHATSLIDESLNYGASKIFQMKVEAIYSEALACKQLEFDAVAGITVKDWLELEPNIPDWRSIKNLTAVAYEARDYSQVKFGKDKRKHCYAGCYISKKQNLVSAIMVGWLKELKDASDCNPETKFELSDYHATVAGAIAAANNTCENFCDREDIKDASGEEMLEIATRENSGQVLPLLSTKFPLPISQKVSAVRN